MAARHKLNPDQLRMFMSADEITAHYQPLEGDRQRVSKENRRESTGEVYARKAREFGPYGEASIAQHGVIDPVHLGTKYGTEGKPQIVGGHHRIAVSMNVNPHRLIPVVHHEGDLDDISSAMLADNPPYPYT